MAENKERKNIAQHIFPTAANLIGLCFVLLSFIKFSNRTRFPGAYLDGSHLRIYVEDAGPG